MNESLKEEIRQEILKTEMAQELRNKMEGRMERLRERCGNSGGHPGIVLYRHVHYNGKEYTVGTLDYNGNDVQFVFDREDYTKVENLAWHNQSGKYIGHTHTKDSTMKVLYLHNLVMNRLDNPGRGATETVDHINRIGIDNRKENLRILSQTEQNMNQKKKVRNVILPENSGIDPDSIPKHIWYVRANGHHGDRFAIELKAEGIVWKGSSSKKIPLIEKLAVAKEKLKELYEEYPTYNPTFEEDRRNQLTESFNAIIAL